MKNIPYWIIGTAMTAGLVAAAAVSDKGPFQTSILRGGLAERDSRKT